jgi:hypothetical protein
VSSVSSRPERARATRRSVTGALASVLAVAVLATSCSQVEATDEVNAGAGRSGAVLATSTTVPSRSVAVAGASRSSGATTQQAELAATVEQLVSQFADDPAALAELLGVDLAQLAAVTGLDPAALANLQISPQTVRALAGVLSGIDPRTLGQLSASGGRLDPALTATILGLATQLDPTVGSALRAIDPAALATLIATATRVDPKITDALGAVLRVVDPNGLGTLAGDRNALAILAVLVGVALRTDPNQFAALGQAAGLDPNLNAAINGISALVGQLTPAVIAQLNQVAKILTPEVVRAIGAGLGLLQRPDVAEVVQAAAADPITLITTLGVAVLLVPGLAEVVAPETFSNPQARYQILLGLLLAAIVNLQGLDLEALAGQLGARSR